MTMIIIIALFSAFALMCYGAVRLANAQMTPADWDRAFAYQREVALYNDDPREWIRQRDERRIALACEASPEDCSRYVRAA